MSNININGLWVIMVSLIFSEDRGYSEFQIRKGEILEDTPKYIKINFGKEPNNVIVYWEKENFTAYNFIVVADDNITMMLNTDKDTVIEKAVMEISARYELMLTEEQKQLIEKMEEMNEEKTDKKDNK